MKMCELGVHFYKLFFIKFWWPEVYTKNLFGYVEHLHYSIKLFFNLVIDRKNKLIMLLDVCLDLDCRY